MKSLIAQLRKIKGCRFVSLRYTSKGTGELSQYTLAIGVSLERAYRRDNAVIRLVQPRTAIEETAKQEIISSLSESLREGIGNNSGYTAKGYYETIFDGCKRHIETGSIYIYGFLLKKKVIVPGTYKEVNSKPLTLAKKALRKRLKIDRFRQFDISFIEEARLEGKTLVLE